MGPDAPFSVSYFFNYAFACIQAYCMTKGCRRVATGVLLLLASVIMNDKVQAAVSKPSQGSTAIDFKALRELERQKMIREMLANKEKQECKPLIQNKSPVDLAQYAIKGPGAPSGVYLIPDWVTEDEAMDLEDAIDDVST